MHITTLFFLVVLFMVASLGGIIAMDSSLSMPTPTTQTDTFGTATTSTTNGTSSVIVSTNAYEERGQSLGAIMLALFVIILIVFTFMAIYRKRSPNYGKYRT